METSSTLPGVADTCLWLRAEGHEDPLGCCAEGTQAFLSSVTPHLSGTVPGENMAVLSNNLSLAPSCLPPFVFPSWMNERQDE